MSSGPKCLRCGAGSEWIKGRVPDETSTAESNLANCRAALGIRDDETIPDQKPVHGSIPVDRGSSRCRISPTNDENIRLETERLLAVTLLRQIMTDLPAKHDWLDPAVEKNARKLLGLMNGRDARAAL